MTYSASICLASTSPRRCELLRQIGVMHVVQPADLNENKRPGELPVEYVERLARSKAEYVWQSRRSSGLETLPVLGADTSVTADGLILGKPADEAALLTTFARLSGREHEVLSAVALVSDAGTNSLVSCTRVRFRAVTVDEARKYWATGEPRDKAGGYAVQGYGAIFIEHIAGSYSGVMGLPLAETTRLLIAVGVSVWHPEV
ncbi:MAG: septum formation inhibitor Maf [Gammaproteobacteria bacterium]|nr:septum formation inhibitor Maf [Gammaproteobacteria bacterium]